MARVAFGSMKETCVGSRRVVAAVAFSNHFGRLATKLLLRGSASSALVLSLGAFGLACSVQAEDDAEKAGADTTQVVTRIEKVMLEDGEVQGAALAGFLRLPPSVDSAAAMRLAGLRQQSPRIGECLETESAAMDESTVADASSGKAELMDAGEVELLTSEGVHGLAPHAFPSAYDLLGGVLYSSRTQDGVFLPAGQKYQLKATLLDLPPALLEMQHPGPDFPEAVRVNGRAWRELITLPDTEFLELSWSPGPSQSADHIVVALSTDTRSLTCRFLDSEAYGPVPLINEAGKSWLTSATEATGADVVRLSISRTRRSSSSVAGTLDTGLYRLEFNFDFARSKLLPMAVVD